MVKLMSSCPLFYPLTHLWKTNQVTTFPLFILAVSSQMLSRLLNSSHPEDLKAANKLIKEMVQEVNIPVCFSSSCSFY